MRQHIQRSTSQILEDVGKYQAESPKRSNLAKARH